MTSILHISDPHFGTEQANVVEALTRFSNAQSPGVLIVSGDITQRARSQEFAAARRFIDRLDVPARLVIPGNHDIPLFDMASRLIAPYARYRRAFGDELEPVLDSPEVLIVGVRTTRRYRHVQGEVSAAQMTAVADRLRGAKLSQLRIVVTHQPVHVTHAEDEENLLRGHAQAITEWSAAGADLILGGHIHRPSVTALHQCIPHLPRPVWSVQAGTALSSRVRFDADNSVNLIRYQADAGDKRQCVVERWDYSRKAGEFLLMSTNRLIF